MRQRRNTVDHESAGQRAQRVQALAGQRDPAHEPQQAPSADDPDARADAPSAGRTGRRPGRHAAGVETAGREQTRPSARYRPGRSRRTRPPGWSPLRPRDLAPAQHREHHRGVGGATAVATSRAPGTSRARRPSAASTAAAAAVRNVPAPRPTRSGARPRNRGQPMCIPPSNRMHIRATVTTCSTVTTSGIRSAGTTPAIAAAPTRISSGVGIRVRSVSRFSRTAISAAALVTSSASAKPSVSVIGSRIRSTMRPPTGLPGTPKPTIDVTRGNRPQPNHHQAEGARNGGRRPTVEAHRAGVMACPRDPTETRISRNAGSPPRGPAPGHPVWLRLSLVFLLGLLVGTLFIAATRPLPSSGGQSSESAVSTTGNPVCDQVAADSEHVADLGGRAAAAARRQDATSLTNLVRAKRGAEHPQWPRSRLSPIAA